MSLPAGSYSIAGGIENVNGGTISFGDGPKVISGTTTNAVGTLDLGDGPHYLPDATVNNSGHLFFGAGPFYFYGTTFTNRNGLVGVGTGASTFYSATFSNRGSGSINFAGGNYYFYDSSVLLRDSTDSAFGPGNFEGYKLKFVAAGRTAVITGPNAQANGSALFAMVDSHFQHADGDFTATGVTFAARNTEFAFGDGGGVMYLSAPTSASPRYGYQNFLVYAPDNGVYFRSTALGNLVTGVIYAPAGVPYFATGTYSPRPGGCLSIVSRFLLLNTGADVYIAPCSNYAWSTSVSSRSFLKN